MPSERSQRRGWIQLVLLALISTVAARPVIEERDPTLGIPSLDLPAPSGDQRPPHYLVGPVKAAVASEDRTCSVLGDVILRDKNGSAVDAAITVTLCIGMLNAFSSGIGGGGFMVVRTPDNQTAAGKDKRMGSGHIVAIDFRETAPAAATQDMYATTGRDGSQIGGLAVGVPGELRGFEAAHKLFGKLPWAEVVQPVADLGINGFQVSTELAKRLNKTSSFMANDPVWREIYWPNGVPAVEGDTIYRKNYGATLSAIAKTGVDAFYKGPIADDIISAVKARGGILNQTDLDNYKIKQYPAISSSFRDKKVYTVDAPSSGLVMLGLLNIYEGLYPKNNECWTEPDIFNRLESIKFAFGARTDVSDPDFGQNRTRLDEIKSKDWAKAQRSLITDVTHPPEYYGMDEITPSDHGTTHIAVLDDSGGAASITSTVNLQWGSRIMTPKTGIILNNEMDDFAIPGAPDAFGLAPQALNFVAPGKRPLSSTAPTIIEDKDGKVYAVLGGSGGSRIFPGVAQVILNMECGQDIGEAIERPRWHNQLSPNVTSLEVGPMPADAPLDVIAGLEKRGYNIGLFDVNANVGQVNGVQVKQGRIWASSDGRKNGVAAGYHD